MKLSILTLSLGSSFSIEELIRISRKYGYAGMEFRTAAGHKHGVELDTSPVRLREIREMIEDAYLSVSCIATECKLDSLDRNVQRRNIDDAKRYVELASAVGCDRVRVFGDRFQKGVGRNEHIEHVACAVKEIAEYAEPYNIDVVFELHGDYNYWKYALKVIENAGRDNIGLVYNSDDRDLVGGSVAVTYSYLKKHIRHVHTGDFLNGFPYRELFRLLGESGYDGFVSAEVTSGSSDPERVLGYYSALFHSWCGDK
jgi:Sugar phosphate isomerases/epimerases